MKLSSIATWGVPSLLLGTVLLCTGCEPKGPAEKAGENIDQGIQNVKDTVDPAGPAEKAGEAVDKALNR